MNSLSFQIRASCLFGALVLSALAQAKVESVVILPQGQNLASHGANAVSLPGLHALLRSPKGSRQVYLFDGVEGQRFDQVTDPSHKAISRDGKRYAYSVFVGDDGVFTFIAIADGAAKRYRITPDGSTSIASMLASSGASARKRL